MGKAKIADLEDYSRCNNFKIHAIPETFQSSDVRDYFTKLLSTVLLDASPTELIVEQIHKLPKIAHLPDSTNTFLQYYR